MGEERARGGTVFGQQGICVSESIKYVWSISSVSSLLVWSGQVRSGQVRSSSPAVRRDGPPAGQATRSPSALSSARGSRVNQRLQQCRLAGQKKRAEKRAEKSRRGNASGPLASASLPGVTALA